MGEQHHLFASHPQTIFINAHLGWLGGNLAELGRLLDQMPNMYTEIAPCWRSWAASRILRASGSSAIRIACCSAGYLGAQRIPYYFRVLETADEYFDYYRKRHAFWKMYGLDLPDEVLKKLY